MTILMRARWATVLSLTLASAGPFASIQQPSKTIDVSRFVGHWVGDTKNEGKDLQSSPLPGLLRRPHGLRIATTQDELVVFTRFQPSSDQLDDPWTNGGLISYRLDGSIAPTMLNGRRGFTTKLSEGTPAGLVLDVLVQDNGQNFQKMTMSLELDRLRLVWTRGTFVATLAYDRQK